MRIRRALVPLVLVAAASLAACGDEGDDGGTPVAADVPTETASEDAAEPDPGGEPVEDVRACDLLSTADVEAAVGTPVKEGIETSGPALTGGEFTTCIWQSADEANPADTATLTVYDNPDAADSARTDDSVEVSGIGDDAFSDIVSSVWVYVADRSFFAQWYVFATMDDEGLEQSKALATAAADALG